MMKFRKFSAKTIVLLSTIFILFMFIGSVFVPLEMKLYESFEIKLRLLWIAHLFLIILGIKYILKNAHKNLFEYKLLFLFILIYLIIGMFLTLTLSTDMRADAYMVKKGSILFDKGNFILFKKGNYFDYYPFQIGLMNYFRILNLINISPRLIFFVNFLQVIAINTIMYRIVKIIGNNNIEKSVLSIFLSFMFLPQLFFIAFGYNLIPGFFFCVLSFWQYIKFNDKNRLLNLMLSILFITISIMIRNNFLIALIAMFLHLLVFKNKKIGVFAIIIYLMVSSVFSLISIKFIESKTGHQISDGAPKSLWVAMATVPDTKYIPGWYNNYSIKTMKENNFDYEKIDKIAKNQIIENAKYFIKHPVYFIKYFSTKFFTTWIEPSFQSFWSGPKEIYYQHTVNPITWSIYNKGLLYEIVFENMKAMMVLIYASTTYYLLKIRKSKTSILFLIYFLGGVFFHLIWETKAQYVYPYVFMMMPLVVDVLYKIGKRN